MDNEKARATDEGGSQKASSAKKTAGRIPGLSDRLAAPVLGDRGEYLCGGCNHEADYAFRIDRYTKKPTWFVGNAFTTRCPRRGDCLRRHCEWLAELGIEVTPEQLLEDPRAALLAAGARASRNDRPPRPLPSLGMIGGWQAAFPGSPGADYFLRRKISLAVAEEAGVGWDRDRHVITFPMYRNGELVAFKTRAPRDGAQMMNIGGRGRPWPLYPRVPREAGWMLVVAGELDALCGISAGIPAVSVTLGASAWRPEWTDDLVGLYVLICFDNNEPALARKRASELREAGIRARHLDLRTLGLSTPKGDVSDYLNSGGDPKRIKRPGRRA
jgi:hypothetical protein